MTVYLICSVAAIICARSGFNFFAGLFLIAAAVWNYVEDYKKSGDILHLRGLFSLFFVGGEGLACFKLSYLGIRWELLTWLSFMAAFVGFYGAYELLTGYFGKISKRGYSRRQGSRGEERTILFFMAVVTVLSVAAFIFEVLRLRYLPIMMKGVPHAYSDFHVSGIHYFTVSCALLPSLAVIYTKYRTGRKQWMDIAAGIMGFMGFLIPIICVSRYQLVFALILAVLTGIAIYGEGEIWIIPAGLAVLIPLYIILSIARSHDASYLMSVFEMRWEKMPLAIAQPYMYVTNNYENFNILVRDLPKHTWGLMALAPFFRLTGLRFLFPKLLVMEYFFNKPELTTLTVIYDAYYDFGVIGVLIFGAVLGACAYFLMHLKNTSSNAMTYLLFSQFALYMILSFFTTWFSNAATWFFFIATGAMYLLWEFRQS